MGLSAIAAVAAIGAAAVAAADVAAAVATVAAVADGGDFLPPQQGVYAANADLIPPFNGSSIDECLAQCLAYGAGCIHVNVCAQVGTPLLRCGIGGWSRQYTMTPGDCQYYQRVRPRDDSPVTPAITPALTTPTGNVTLHGGVLAAALATNVQYLLSWDVDDLLYNFRKRAGLPNPGHCVGWDCTADWVEGSLAGLFMMGAGGVLRWVEVPQLRANLDALIDGIEECTEPSGYLMAFNESALATDEHPDYTLSWTTHGFLEAAVAGNPKALPLIRGMVSLFNNHTLLPTFLVSCGTAAWRAGVAPADFAILHPARRWVRWRSIGSGVVLPEAAASVPAGAMLLCGGARRHRGGSSRDHGPASATHFLGCHLRPPCGDERGATCHIRHDSTSAVSQCANTSPRCAPTPLCSHLMAATRHTRPRQVRHRQVGMV